MPASTTLVLCCLIFCLPISLKAGDLISDSVVSNLDCSTLTKESFLRSFQQRTRTTKAWHIPLQNWSFSVGLYDLAGCWSLSRSQRLVTYLGRTELQPTPQLTESSLNQFRKYIPWLDVEGRKRFSVHRQFQWIPWNQEAFASYQRGFRTAAFHRNFKNDIETYQNIRFHRLQNIGMIRGDRERSRSQNQKSFLKLKTNLEQNKMTLVNLRPQRTVQHVVMIKDMTLNHRGQYEFRVYDSNYPFKDQFFSYDPKTQHFYAPEIIRAFRNVPNPEAPVGLYIVDEKERDDLIETLVKIYQRTCRSNHGR